MITVVFHKRPITVIQLKNLTQLLNCLISSNALDNKNLDHKNTFYKFNG